MLLCVTSVANIQKYYFSMINVLVSWLWQLKTAIFTGLYLGLWCEHSVETNVVHAVVDQLGQHIPIVKFLCFYKIEIDGLWCCVENHTFLLGHD